MARIQGGKRKAEGGSDRRAAGATRPVARRRGVILLVVLAILSMFTLMMITFLIATAASKTGLKHASKAEQTGDPPQALLHAAFLQVLRGPRNPASVMGAHSLLEDIYGNRTVRGTLASAPTTVGSAQILQFTANWQIPTGELEPTDGFYNGRVMTFVRGAAAGRSARIVGYSYSGGTHTLQILSPEGVSPGNGDPFLINGRPFSGTGFGFQLTSFQPAAAAPFPTRLLDAHDAHNADHLYALLPNHAVGRFEPTAGTYDDPAGPGGANEDYDAADFQNLLLSMSFWDTSVNPPVFRTVLPSLHRPDLINYWNNYSGTGQKPEPRTYILRPLQVDHAKFTGSNPGFDPVNGPWDVDNNGDGEPDSVWVDLGMPVQTGPDGRRYKPLFAVLCVDMDGKLNLNAHGNWRHVEGTVTSRRAPVSAPFAMGATGQTPQRLRVGSGYGPAEISLGPLFTGTDGNNEHSYLLGGILDYDTSALTPLRDYTEGRYGEVQRTLSSGIGPGMSNLDDPLTYLSSFEHPAITNWNVDASSGIHSSDWSNNYLYNNLALSSSFNSPPDLDGDGMIALDLRGQPLYIDYAGLAVAANADDAGWGEPNDRVDDPYELDLSLNGQRTSMATTSYASQNVTSGMAANQVSSIDVPFSAAEVERLLRYNDVDAANLPDRICRLAPNAFGDPLQNIAGSAPFRTAITHASFDLPTPSLVVTSQDMLKDLFGDGSIGSKSLVSVLGGTPSASMLTESNLTRMLQAKLVANGFTPANGPAMQQVLKQMLWYDAVMGTRMDINRPLGNGRDDNNNGIVDEPTELNTLLGGSVQYGWKDIFPAPGVPFDLNNDGVSDTSDSRQLMAKHLYILMMLLKGDNFTVDIDGDGNKTAIEAAYYFAQIAVNIVDFRDADSIMTPFEFDTDPFLDNSANTATGPWEVDGKINTGSLDNGQPNRGLVWGCERPELLITETLAFHDRKTDDRDNDDNDSKKVGPQPNDDKDLDQIKRPEGSLFVELFNPNRPVQSETGTTANPYDNPPRELYSQANGIWGVDLTKTAPPMGAGFNKGAPVWRLVITVSDKNAQPNGDYPSYDLDAPQLPGGPPAPPQIERSVYFVNFSPGTDAGVTGDGFITYHRPIAGEPQAPSVIAPNHYAVIGPHRETEVGKTPGATPIRSIQLNQQPNPTVNQVQVVNNNHATSDPNLANIKPAVAFVISSPQRLSVSEPLGTANDPFYSGFDATGLYPTPLDDPLDYHRVEGDYPSVLMRDETTINFRTVHLQRLANPLLPWNKDSNPYLSVDSAPVDLTVFNGEAGTPPADADERNFPNKNVRFATRERGNKTAVRTAPPAGPAVAPNLWTPEFNNTVMTKANGMVNDLSLQDNTHYFEFKLVHSLGYLNKTFGDHWGANDAPTGNAQFAASNYRGDPKAAFPWLTWNNRPYVSGHELMMVPSQRSSRLLASFTPADATATYNPAGTKTGEFGHLANFYHTSTTTPGAEQGPNLYRLLEFVHVPSRFAGTETWLKPGSLNPNHTFNPPFNRVSNFRDPGRININTIFDATGNELTWQGIMDADPAFVGPSQQMYFDLVKSRRGMAGGQAYSFDPSYPTIFARPFRSYAGQTLVPKLYPITGTDPNGTRMRDALVVGGREVNATLLRASPGNVNGPLFQSTSATPHIDATRNAYFRYQDMMRLSNMLTTRSNVYAIWVTVGYFEVERVAVDQAHPDGWQLGAEIGIDTGEVKRHRAFYMIDRTIPVGFERGENHNVDKAILVQRFIE